MLRPPVLSTDHPLSAYAIMSGFQNHSMPPPMESDNLHSSWWFSKPCSMFLTWVSELLMVGLFRLIYQVKLWEVKWRVSHDGPAETQTYACTHQSVRFTLVLLGQSLFHSRIMMMIFMTMALTTLCMKVSSLQSSASHRWWPRQSSLLRTEGVSWNWDIWFWEQERPGQTRRISQSLKAAASFLLPPSKETIHQQKWVFDKHLIEPSYCSSSLQSSSNLTLTSDDLGIILILFRQKQKLRPERLTNVFRITDHKGAGGQTKVCLTKGSVFYHHIEEQDTSRGWHGLCVHPSTPPLCTRYNLSFWIL